MKIMTTTDLRDFGFRELDMAGDLLKAISSQGLPVEFDADGVHVMMNQNSGNVFLTNAEFQVAMLNGDDLESFHSCPQCGHEGFRYELEHNEDNAECQEWLAEIDNI